MGEPNSNPSGVSMMQLYSKIAQDGNRLVLTGDGADEVFAGYNRYNKILKTEKFPNFENALTLRILNSFLYKNRLISNCFYAMQPKFSFNSWYRWHQVVSPRYLNRFFEDYVESNFASAQQETLNVMKTNKVSNIMYKDLKFWLAMESNNKLDRISMNYSIEARSPFMSETLIGVGLREMSNSDFRILNKTNLVKNFPDINRIDFNQIKMGFISPLGFWLRTNSNLIVESINYIKRNFNFNERELNRLVNSPAKQDYSSFRFLWSLIILAKWHESEKS
jgi:asparagine synthase (glutamine-hydrolysing)